MIRAVFFDLDDTLIGYAAAERAALEAAGAVLCVKTDDLAAALYAAYTARYDYGTPGYAELAALTEGELRGTLTADAMRTLGIATDAALAQRAIETYAASERAALKPFGDTLDTLDSLARRYPLGVITNGPSSMQRAKLAATGLRHQFALIVVDTEFGHPKPDPRIFAHAAARIGFAPDELLFVGNSAEADVAGARAAGWTSVYLNAAGTPFPASLSAPHYTIRTLTELCALPPLKGGNLARPASD